jgi:transposase
MYIRKSIRKAKNGKHYVNYLLVESVSTPKGPRQRSICSLGSLEPGPPERWHALAKRLEAALAGQLSLGEPDPLHQGIVAKARKRGQRAKQTAPTQDGEVVAVKVDAVEVEEAREAGPVHVANQFFIRLGMEEVLAQAGLSERARELTKVMVLNRLISPGSEHSMPLWVNTTALEDIMGVSLSDLREDALYRNLDRLHPMQEQIEAGLRAREVNLFSLDSTIYLYDLTSTYFEGQCEKNQEAKRGYSRDKRPDCNQVLVGLVVDREGFPVKHEVFEGNRADSTTLGAMLEVLERSQGKKQGVTVVVDRGMAQRRNLELIKSRGYHYVVAARQAERDRWLGEFEEEGFMEVSRGVSATNLYQKKSRVEVKKKECDGQLYVLVISQERAAKDRAIREGLEKRLIQDLEKLSKRIAQGRLSREDRIYEAIGRIKERYPRVARYYEISYHKEKAELSWVAREEKKLVAEKLDGSYLLKTDRRDLGAEEAWHIYSLLSRAERAFRSMKSPLAERPIFHQLKERVRAHIFLCVLAYHLLVAIEKSLQDRGVHSCWATVREMLKTHQVVTMVLPTADGRVLKLRCATRPSPQQLELYTKLNIACEPIKPKKTWLKAV